MRHAFSIVASPSTSRHILPHIRCLATPSSAAHAGTRSLPSLDILFISSDSSTDDVRSKILQCALAMVPTHGFSTAAIEEGAKQLGYPSIAHGMFPRGSIDLISHFLDTAKEGMRRDVLKMDLSSMKTTSKVRAGVVSRLEFSKPVISQWPEAAAQLALPQNLDVALKGLGELVDEIWFLAGDRSVDMNWYSKRTLLAGVYSSTEMYMTQDTSPEYRETSAFLDRRLSDVAFIGKSIGSVKSGFEFAFQTASGILQSRGFKP
ncbi:hypothetical protein SeMB42_g03334 [Synchytrium endobioticum]|uniref:Ubiquinone biosynthesis protein n=1 Tax=Synchytrium endobioticum TaxID=286115 RepID=A0A507D937_9FUNG|nr:hypothetical protein SeMB42_g03334 [Synchytrium endobioticum]TPX47771.1 hypothetical protein SeLEV6574_g02467 [Synchytrium endobioticum]